MTSANADLTTAQVRRGRALFTRTHGGGIILAVELAHPGDAFGTAELSAEDWASVVAAVSAHGDTARAFALAERFHRGLFTEHRRHP